MVCRSSPTSFVYKSLIFLYLHSFLVILGLVMDTTHVVTQLSEIFYTVVGSDISNLLLFLMIMWSIQCPHVCVGQFTSCWSPKEYKSSSNAIVS